MEFWAFNQIDEEDIEAIYLGLHNNLLVATGNYENTLSKAIEDGFTGTEYKELYDRKSLNLKMQLDAFMRFVKLTGYMIEELESDIEKPKRLLEQYEPKKIQVNYITAEDINNIYDLNYN